MKEKTESVFVATVAALATILIGLGVILAAAAIL